MKTILISSRTKSPLHQLSVAAATILIRGYQVIISPIIGPCCRFYPSCSIYALEALDRHGLMKGTYLCIRRLLKCHPFHPGGVDPVP